MATLSFEGGCKNANYQAIKRGLLTVDQIRGVPLLYTPKSFKMVDTCAGEFAAETPYFYTTTNGDNEAEHFIAHEQTN